MQRFGSRIGITYNATKSDIAIEIITNNMESFEYSQSYKLIHRSNLNLFGEKLRLRATTTYCTCKYLHSVAKGLVNWSSSLQIANSVNQLTFSKYCDSWRANFEWLSSRSIDTTVAATETAILHARDRLDTSPQVVYVRTCVEDYGWAFIFLFTASYHCFMRRWQQYYSNYKDFSSRRSKYLTHSHAQMDISLPNHPWTRPPSQR
jgi:hypothetical protein